MYAVIVTSAEGTRYLHSVHAQPIDARDQTLPRAWASCEVVGPLERIDIKTLCSRFGCE